MKSKNKTHFYKMILMQSSFFVRAYGIAEPEELCPGRVFRAHGRPMEWCLGTDNNGDTVPRVCMFNRQPLIHFCDNMIDMLMWYWVGMDDCPSYREVYFYEVIPSVPYYKKQCTDDNALYQCGARAIRIKRQLSTGDVMRIALKEINKNPDEIINRYPNHNMLKIMMRIRDDIANKR